MILASPEKKGISADLRQSYELLPGITVVKFILRNVTFVQ